MDADVWLPLGTAVVGAAAALAGGALSPLVGARRAHAQWLRDKRAELLERYYAVLVEAEDDLARRSSDTWFQAFASEEVQAHWFEEHKPHSRDILNRLRDSASRAALYISPELIDLLNQVWADYHVSYESQKDYEEMRWRSDFDEWLLLVRRAHAGIRKELDVA